MPGEVATATSHNTSVTPKSLKSRNVSTASSASHMSKLTDGCAKEFFWGCELSKDNKETTWTFEEEEDDQDFLVHTLFLRHVVLGTSAGNDDRNVLEIETKGFSGETVKQPIAVLGKGNEMCQLDLNFSHEIPVTFRLAEGSGPIYISAQHLVEFPQELNESEYTATETDFTDASDEASPAKGTKRKAGSLGAARKKQGKLDNANVVQEDEEDDGDEELEEDSMDEDESMEDIEEDESDEEEVESSPEKPVKKGKKGKAAAAATKATKKEKPAPVVAKGKKGKKTKSK